MLPEMMRPPNVERTVMVREYNPDSPIGYSQYTLIFPNEDPVSIQKTTFKKVTWFTEEDDGTFTRCRNGYVKGAIPFVLRPYGNSVGTPFNVYVPVELE